MMQKVKQDIFVKNINNKYKLVPFTLRNDSTGPVRYSPAISKEWKNSVYFYNQNYIKNLFIYDINIYTLIRSYFNIYFNEKFIINKFKNLKKNKKKKRLSLKRKLSFKKIFVSKPEIKHTNSKALITIYVYNREKKSLLAIIRRLKRFYFLFNFLLKKRLFKVLRIRKKRFNKKHKLIYKIPKNYKQILSKWIILKKLRFKVIKWMLFKELRYIRKQKLKLSLNEYKFKDILLYKLSKLISKFFNKKVEFNIINLKYFILNTDILTEILTLKLKKDRANVTRMMNFILNKAHLSEVNVVKEKSRIVKNVDYSLAGNMYKSLNLNAIMATAVGITPAWLLKKEYKNNNFDEILNKAYNNVNSTKLNNQSTILLEIKNIIFNYIKYKNMSGIRLEVKGRLTKRYRADRAIFKVRWKGGLKNLDASYKGLSGVKLKGYANSNVEYSIRTSKRRIGAFAVKGWMSGK